MKPIDVLFLCETNAATSLMAEALVNSRGDIRLQAFSAGRMPAERMVEEAREVLSARGISTDALEPKSWSIFSLPGARRPDLVVDLGTVCWTQPELAALSDEAPIMWPFEDPALVGRPAARRKMVASVLETLARRVDRELYARAEAIARRRQPALKMPA